MGVDVEIADTVADTDDVADEGNGFPVSENVLHQHGTQPFEHGSFGQVDFRLERDATVPDSMGAAASDPISQFGTLVSDPISQFSLSGYMHGAEPFDIDLADGEKNLDEWSVCGSGIDESINRLNLRRALGSQHDDVHSAGASEPGGGAATSDDSVVREKMPNLNHEAAMQAFNNSLNVSAPKFMWETDSFLSAVFNSDGSIVDQLFKPVSLKRPAPCFVDLSNDSMDKTPIAKALRSGAVKPIYLGSFSRASSENENSKRKSFLFGWVTLVLINCSAFSVLDDALSDVDQPSRDIVMRCLAECFAAKATSTLGKRLGAMSKYAAHCEPKSLQAFPLSERSLYSYLSALHDDPKSSASVGKSSLEAVRFSAAMIGLHGLDKDRVPQRVSGLAELLAKRAPCVKQASPLTVQQVAILEETCCTADAMQDRILVGGLLLMLYSCARASDMSRVVKLVIDRVQSDGASMDKHAVAGFIEASALHTKGARSQSHKRTLLPLVAPMVGVSEWRWWDSYIQAREAMGISVKGGLTHPLLCRFDDQGLPLEDSLQASEVGRYLRNVLNVIHASVNEIRSHSLKVTALSWMAKAGCSLSVRRSLGHHLDPGARSATIYSRDAMAPPLRELCRVMQLIASKQFFPDNTRSGRFQAEIQAAPTTRTEQDSDGESNESYEMPFSERMVGDTDDSDTDSSSDAGEISDQEPLDTTTLWELVEPRHRPNLVQVKVGLETWMHVQSHVMHLLAKDSQRFICGRVASGRYAAVQQGASSECTRCQVCYTSKLAVDGARMPAPS